ncbi:MAG: sigma-70 family RNA polymerase sigma factor [Acidobacteria bacterium]|nr:MAG: sigma-70 family RNA polymerase sigma factor [Acidobacteriota bacterium]
MRETDVTELLHAWRAGDQAALTRLLPRVYEDLRRLAGRHLARERAGHTLQPTALVNECYLELLDQNRVDWQDRAHFLAIAARTMRRILIAHARKRRAMKRGGGVLPLTLDEALEVAGGRRLDLLALDDALRALEALSPRQSQVVELRFFGGLTIPETAAVLGVSPATVKNDWQMARAWLFNELRKG